MEYQIDEIYKGNINDRLLKICDIKNENGRDYIVVKNLNSKKNELETIQIDIGTFKRLQLTKIVR